jgi:tetratricopeptide (TPR) repeat protein
MWFFMRVKLPIVIIAMLLASAAVGRADELWIGSAGSGAIQIRSARITRVDAGVVYFTAGGKETSRELDKVQRIFVDNEPALNAAEEAYAIGRWSDAVDGYQKTVRASTRPWLKDWAAARLIDSANRSGRFDAAATVYLSMLLKDPAQAATFRPAMPEQRSSYLDTAVTEVTGALAGRNLTDQQRQALLSFLMDLHRARQDPAAEERAAVQLDEILARDPNNPAAARAIARRTIATATQALQARDYRRAIDEISSVRVHLGEPQQQSDALMIVADASHGLADPKDPAALKDAALAYMRLVAHFKNRPGERNVPQALLKTAMIHEQLGELDTAAMLYEQVMQQYAGDPAAEAARQKLQRLVQQSSKQ